MKQKEIWAEGCIEGLKMEYCRPLTEKEVWLSGFHYANMKILKKQIEDHYDGSGFMYIDPQDVIELGEEEVK